MGQFPQTVEMLVPLSAHCLTIPFESQIGVCNCAKVLVAIYTVHGLTFDKSNLLIVGVSSKINRHQPCGQDVRLEVLKAEEKSTNKSLA